MHFGLWYSLGLISPTLTHAFSIYMCTPLSDIPVHTPEPWHQLFLLLKMLSLAPHTDFLLLTIQASIQMSPSQKDLLHRHSTTLPSFVFIGLLSCGIVLLIYCCPWVSGASSCSGTEGLWRLAFCLVHCCTLRARVYLMYSRNIINTYWLTISNIVL